MMFWLTVGVAGWLLTSVLLCVLAARAGAKRAQAQPENVEEWLMVDRREGPLDRRDEPRVWSDDGPPGRRREDILRRELALTRRKLREAEAQLEREQRRHVS